MTKNNKIGIQTDEPEKSLNPVTRLINLEKLVYGAFIASIFALIAIAITLSAFLIEVLTYKESLSKDQYDLRMELLKEQINNKDCIIK